VGEHSDTVEGTRFPLRSDRLLSFDASGEIRTWSIEEGAWALERTIQSGLTSPDVALDRSGSTLVAGRAPFPDVALVWDLNGPPDADPLALRKGDLINLLGMAVDGRGQWLAAANNSDAVLWPLGGRRARIIRGQAPPEIVVAFTPDRRWLASSSSEGVLRLWPLSPAVAPARRILMLEETNAHMIAVGPEGRKILVTSRDPGRATLVPLDGGTPRTLERFSSALMLESPAISRDGRFAAAGSRARPEGNLIEVWDLESGTVRGLDPRSPGQECGAGLHTESAVFDVEFTSDGRLLSAGLSGLRLWDVDDGTNTLLRPCADGPMYPFLAGSLEDRFLLGETDIVQKTSLLSFHDLRAGVSRELTSFGNDVLSVALDPKAEIAATGDWDGLVRVGPVTGEEPHLLYGHDLEVLSVAVSPDGRWVASGSQDGTIRLWPMPEGRPFHTLPYDELLARLRSFTNLRVVRDEGSETGYRVEAGPFPGWAVLPEW
jgi:WD40 repeat protein